MGFKEISFTFPIPQKSIMVVTLLFFFFFNFNFIFIFIIFLLIFRYTPNKGTREEKKRKDRYSLEKILDTHNIIKDGFSTCLFFVIISSFHFWKLEYFLSKYFKRFFNFLHTNLFFKFIYFGGEIFSISKN